MNIFHYVYLAAIGVASFWILVLHIRLKKSYRKSDLNMQAAEVFKTKANGLERKLREIKAMREAKEKSDEELLSDVSNMLDEFGGDS